MEFHKASVQRSVAKSLICGRKEPGSAPGARKDGSDPHRKEIHEPVDMGRRVREFLVKRSRTLQQAASPPHLYNERTNRHVNRLSPRDQLTLCLQIMQSDLHRLIQPLQL